MAEGAYAQRKNKKVRGNREGDVLCKDVSQERKFLRETKQNSVGERNREGIESFKEREDNGLSSTSPLRVHTCRREQRGEKE